MRYKVKVYYNVAIDETGRPARTWNGYQPEHPMAYEDSFEFVGPLEKAAEEAFRRYNVDSRPNGKVNRSMCVGDIATVFDYETGKTTTYICESVGWEQAPDWFRFKVATRKERSDYFKEFGTPRYKRDFIFCAYGQATLDRYDNGEVSVDSFGFLETREGWMV